MYYAKAREKGNILHKLPIYLAVSETTGTWFLMPVKYKQICQVLSHLLSLSSLLTELPVSLIPVFQNSGHIRSKTSLPQLPCFHPQAVQPSSTLCYFCLRLLLHPLEPLTQYDTGKTRTGFGIWRGLNPRSANYVTISDPQLLPSIKWKQYKYLISQNYCED